MRLILATARPSVLHDFLTTSGADPSTILTSSAPDLGPDFPVIRVSPGPLSWNHLSREMRDGIRNAEWNEIVILHNGGTGYVPVYLLAARIRWNLPVILYFFNGRSCRYSTALHLMIDRTVERMLKGCVDALFFLLYVPVCLVVKIHNGLVKPR
ncbi:MAG: hypothetical protein AAB229_04280 [Candidatus Hydrogenedentota bacterium]